MLTAVLRRVVLQLKQLRALSDSQLGGKSNQGREELRLLYVKF